MRFSSDSLGDNYVQQTGYDANASPKLMLFDVAVAGHHAAYIRHLVRYWRERELPGCLNVVVSPKFVQQHSDIVDIALGCDRKNINFVTISPEEETLLRSDTSRFDRIWRGFQEWQLICKYARSLEATHCLIMYLDLLKFPLAFGAKPPCFVSGIYFQPKFHYSDFANYLPSLKERVQQWRDKSLLLRVLHNPHLKILFCLDPFVGDYINKFNGSVTAVHLPDPLEILPTAECDVVKIRESLGIYPGRQVLLLFGSLTRRKGIQQLLKAISMLPPNLGQKLCLLLLGVPHPLEEKSLIESWIGEARRSLPMIQIIAKYEFIPEPDVCKYFQMADVVLVPYQQQVGTSGILLLAAAAQKPVLSTNYGLIGDLVQRYHLGLTVDSAVPGEIAKGLSQLIESPEQIGDISKMKSFVEKNTPEEFASIIFQHM